MNPSEAELQAKADAEYARFQKMFGGDDPQFSLRKETAAPRPRASMVPGQLAAGIKEFPGLRETCIIQSAMTYSAPLEGYPERKVWKFAVFVGEKTGGKVVHDLILIELGPVAAEPDECMRIAMETGGNVLTVSERGEMTTDDADNVHAQFITEARKHYKRVLLPKNEEEALAMLQRLWPSPKLDKLRKAYLDEQRAKSKD